MGDDVDFVGAILLSVYKKINNFYHKKEYNRVEMLLVEEQQVYKVFGFLVPAIIYTLIGIILFSVIKHLFKKKKDEVIDNLNKKRHISKLFTIFMILLVILFVLSLIGGIASI